MIQTTFPFLNPNAWSVDGLVPVYGEGGVMGPCGHWCDWDPHANGVNRYVCAECGAACRLVLPPGSKRWLDLELEPEPHREFSFA